VFADSEIPDATVELITEHFNEEFSDKLPVVKNLVNEKAIEKNNKEKKEVKLLEEVASLKQELKDTKQENEEKTEQIETLVKMEAPLNAEEAKTWAEVFLRMKPEKAGQVKSEVIDGQKYLLIPMEEDEMVNLNGVISTEI
jgi:dsDNA-specific endonuclease/ATPase MutS2